jgi:hypothetical protein
MYPNTVGEDALVQRDRVGEVRGLIGTGEVVSRHYVD